MTSEMGGTIDSNFYLSFDLVLSIFDAVPRCFYCVMMGVCLLSSNIRIFHVTLL